MRQSLESEISYLTAGTTLSATVSSSTYTPDAYTLQYRFRRASTVLVADAVGDTSAGTWSVELDDEATSDLEPGIMSYVAYATDTAGTVYEAEAGGVAVRGNPAMVTRAQMILDAIVSVIEGRANDGQATVALGDVQLQHMTPDELHSWEGMYRERVNAQERRLRKSHGLASGRTIRTRFGS